MSTFALRVVTPEGEKFKGEAEKILFSAESCKKRKRKSSFSFKGLFLFFLGLSLGATVTLIISLFVF